MKDWIPYVGQQVVSLVKSFQTNIGDVFEVKGVKKHCCIHLVDIGLICPVDFTGQCMVHKTIISVKQGEELWAQSECFAPAKKAKTKYTIKEVEVAPQIREMEVQLS